MTLSKEEKDKIIAEQVKAIAEKKNKSVKPLREFRKVDGTVPQHNFIEEVDPVIPPSKVFEQQKAIMNNETRPESVVFKTTNEDKPPVGTENPVFIDTAGKISLVVCSFMPLDESARSVVADARKKKYNQTQIAAKLGISSVYYAKIEKGEVNVSAEILSKLSELLGLTRVMVVLQVGTDFEW